MKPKNQRDKEPFLEPILRKFRIKRVIKHIPQGCRLLDVGCGHSATFLRAISNHISEGVGVDFKVTTESVSNISTIQTHIENELPFADASFDVVTMLAVLEHIEDDVSVIAETHRVLKPQGKLILTVPSVWAKPVLEFLAFRLGLVSRSEILDHKQYYTRQKLMQDLIIEGNFTNFYHYYFQLGMNNFCIVEKP
jgi:ubiquinone/menaquinone biosynthesis C-methylase UbiE